MNAMIQIRNVPQKLHRQLKARAALEGISMSQFILREIERVLERPSRDDVLRRIAEQEGTYLSQPAADVLRAERDSR
ncbi:MAG TPA: toxin-antitoxin system HicB family antitoxin [Gammaproteobacteria bacterium]|nr:toxin-antitoxin system HicB family antitoxin [Gammaproteobacteria bacterium]